MKTSLIGMIITTLVITTAQALASEAVQQTRVAWLATCPSDPPADLYATGNRSAILGALVTAIGAKVVDGAVDSAAEALKAAGQTKTFATTAKSASDFYEITPSADLKVAATCLVVVRGVFDDKKTSFAQWAENSDALRGLQSTSFHLEAKLKALRGLKYFQLVPQYFKVGEFQESGLFAPSERDYVVAVTFTVPGAAQPFGSAEMSFKNVVRNTEWKNNEWPLRSATSLPIAFPTESTDATKAKTKREAELAPLLLAQDILETPPSKPFTNAPDVYDDSGVRNKTKAVCDAIDVENRRLNDEHQLTEDRCAYLVTKAKAALDVELETAHRNNARRAWAASVCRLDTSRTQSAMIATKCTNEKASPALAGQSFTYFTTQLTLSETREGSKFAMFLGNALSAAKSDVSSALQSKLLPKTQAAKDSDEAAARTARTSVLVADLEVTKAEEGLADALAQDPPVPVDITSARIVLLKAKITANDAYRKASLPVPYPEIGG